MFEIFNPLFQIINQKKKFGGWGGAGERKGGVSHELNTIDNVDAYGNTKKSLGTRYEERERERERERGRDVLHGILYRRTPGSQFVPPIKKTATSNDEIRYIIYQNYNTDSIIIL